MKTPVGLVAIALAVAILLATLLLVVTGTRGESHDGALRMLPPYDHLWKMKNAPAAMKPNPSA
jgi:hypothetical protein